MSVLRRLHCEKELLNIYVRKKLIWNRTSFIVPSSSTKTYLLIKKLREVFKEDFFKFIKLS